MLTSFYALVFDHLVLHCSGVLFDCVNVYYLFFFLNWMRYLGSPVVTGSKSTPLAIGHTKMPSGADNKLIKMHFLRMLAAKIVY